MPQFGVSLTDNYRVIIYDRNMFIKQATVGKNCQLIFLILTNLTCRVEELFQPNQSIMFKIIN